MPYEGYKDVDGPSTLPEADYIKDYNIYMKAEVMLPRGGYHQQAARFVGVNRNNDGQTVG